LYRHLISFLILIYSGFTHPHPAPPPPPEREGND
jgi:hypothetical protein